MAERELSVWTPRPWPDAAELEGRWCCLERLDPSRHGDDLYEASSAPGAAERFCFLFESAPADRSAFDAWLDKAASSDDPRFYAVIDRATARAEGRQALMRITPEHGVMEIGSILWGPQIARTRVATEALYLSAAYVFETLGYRRFEWKCDALNTPSRRAALRFGFTFEGIFRSHMVVKGKNRDTAWYAMTEADWPRLRAGMERWLTPENFDAAGRQRQSLRDVIAARA
ncbi:MAG: GNAT family N-acetyltransferase [Propylenella sp.]